MGVCPEGSSDWNQTTWHQSPRHAVVFDLQVNIFRAHGLPAGFKPQQMAQRDRPLFREALVSLTYHLVFDLARAKSPTFRQ